MGRAAVTWEELLRASLPRGLGGEDQVPASRWADQLGDAWAYSRDSIFLGYRNGKGVGCRDDRHVVLVAGSRAGKGVSVVIPNLLLYEGSVLALDPKGELAKITARRRAAGMRQDVYVIDPFNESTDATKPYRANFNPLKEIDPDSRTAIDDAAFLADTLIVDEGGGEKHWTNGARELVKLLILDALSEPAERRNLSHVRSFFHAPGDVGRDGKPISGSMFRLREIAAKADAFDGMLPGLADAFIGKNERELNSIISTAEVQLAILDSKPLSECLKSSSFRLADLKERRATVYLCLPASRMATHAKWFRMVVGLSLLMCERVKTIPTPPLLLLLEEFPVLGHMRPIEAAAGQIAGFGVKIFTILQDLTQLQRHYRESWETFIGNSGALIFFGNSDMTTLEYVSKKLGTIGFDLKRMTGATPAARLGGAQVIQDQLQLGRLLEPHEIERVFARDYDRALVLYPGCDPLIVRRAHYYSDPALKELRL